MFSVLRTALICMLLVAVPLQGFAAGAMLFCGSGQGSVKVVPAHAHADDSAAQSHHAQANGAQTGHEQPGSDEDGFELPSFGHLHDGTCSVCASCCSGAALPLSTAMMSFQAEHRAPRDDFLQPDPGHSFPGPERPPRRLLA